MIANPTRSPFETGATVIRKQLKTMPGQPGVYRMLSAKGDVLYVGKAKDLKKRVTAYTQRARLPHRIQRMVAQTCSMEIVVTRTEAEALLLEASLIQRFMPPFNILFRDDKSYPYILISRDHDFPQILKHRGSQSRKGWYFGPFASAGAVDETIILMQRAFMLRNCSNPFFAARTRPCLQYHIKRCTAPCVGKVGKEAYVAQVEQALDFLRGKSQQVQNKLALAMQKASDAQDYERAAILRDRICVLTSVQAKQDIHRAGLGDADVIAAHQTAGRTAIQLFFFRADRNYGTRTIYLNHPPLAGGSKSRSDFGEGSENPSPAKTKDLLPPTLFELRRTSRKSKFLLPLPQGERDSFIGNILSAFIAQFYRDKPVPPQLLLSHAPAEARLLAEALTEQSGHKVTLFVPKLGEKKRLVDHARQNAKAALGRKMAEASEQEKLLKRVAELFRLPEPPRRIEVYDNSHTSGTFPIGAMIAAGSEGFLKKTYRKFNIREASGGDDVGMMNEVLTRRFQRLIDEDPERTSGLWPDLILIDGGQGQLNKAASALQELGITDVSVVGIAKGPDRNAGRERFFTNGNPPISLPPEDPVLYYLQRLRDEAHRFAIGTHRARRTKAINQSGLDDVPGIGATRKRALLHHFGSAKAVAGAGLDELLRVPGISATMAKIVHDYFHGG